MKIGITGGIGSGKTTICRLFEVFGIPVYYADTEARRLMIEDVQLVADIKTLLGKEAYFEDGQLNKQYVARQIFGDLQILAAMNALVHPAVHRDANKWAAQQTHAPYSLREAALIFESGGEAHLDYVITVFAPKSVRLERVMARDGIDRAAVKARMNKQLPDEEKVKRADFIIYNDGQQSIIRQVHQLHHQLIALSTKE